MNNRALVFVGAGLLAVGLFIPIIRLPFVGAVAIFGSGSNLTAYVIAALAALAAFAAHKNKEHDAFSPGVASLLLVTAIFVQTQIAISNAKDQFADQMEGNPFGAMAANMMDTVQLQWGWIPLVLGSGLLIYTGLQGRKAEAYQSETDDRIRIGSMVLLTIGGVWLLYTAGVFGGDEPEMPDSASDVELGAGLSMEEFGSPTSEETKYMRDFVDVYDVSASWRDSMLDGRVPGVDFKVKNNGDRTLDSVTVTVIFYDKNDNAIAEDEFYPVIGSGFGDSPPLRPGYIWQQERGRFYAAKSVPDEWKAGRVTAKVTDIEFGAASN